MMLLYEPIGTEVELTVNVAAVPLVVSDVAVARTVLPLMNVTVPAVGAVEPVPAWTTAVKVSFVPKGWLPAGVTVGASVVVPAVAAPATGTKSMPLSSPALAPVAVNSVTLFAVVTLMFEL